MSKASFIIKVLNDELVVTNLTFEEKEALRNVDEPIFFELLRKIFDNHVCLEVFINSVANHNKLLFIIRNQDYSEILVEILLVDLLKMMEEFLKSKEISLLEKIEVKKTIKSLSKKRFDRKIDIRSNAYKGVSYLRIFKYLLNPEVDSDTILGKDIVSFVKILSSPPINFSAYQISNCRFTNINDYFTDDEFSLIKINASYLIYNYESDPISKRAFRENDPFPYGINQELEQEILSEIPENYSNIQKAYYIYNRLCQILTYDDERIVNHHLSDGVIDHCDLQRLPRIGFNNNKVMCHEAAVILAKLYKKLGIKYSIICNEQFALHRDYGKGSHFALVFKCDEYVVIADPAQGLIESDMSLSKVRGFSNEFVPLNKAKRILDKYYEELAVVDDYIIDKNKELGYDHYISIYDKYKYAKYLDFDSKLMIFFKEMSKCKLPQTDGVCFLDWLGKILFPSFNKTNFKISYVKYTVNDVSSLALVIIFNSNDDIYGNIDSNSYYLVSNFTNCSKVTLNELQEMVKYGIVSIPYKYTKCNIPGLEMTINKKK